MSDTEDDSGPIGPFAYTERPRSYLEALVVLVVLGIGFGVDLAFDVPGAVTHLPGWLIAGALLIGIDLLLVASARSTRSLFVTATELWVGDEVVARGDIAGRTAPTKHLPILGWPHGRPGRTKGVALRLADGRDVLVPSRRPERLVAELGVGDAAPAATTIEIRVAEERDLPMLAEIDERSEAVFRVSGYDLPALPMEPGEIDGDLHVLVAGDPPVGFARLGEVDGDAHLEEIAVLPAIMGTGVGARLLAAACDWAREAGYDAMTLTTYSQVRWNGPWYVRRGFVEMTDPTPGLVAIREKEAAVGLDAVGPRIVMRRDLRT